MNRGRDLEQEGEDLDGFESGVEAGRKVEDESPSDGKVDLQSNPKSTPNRLEERPGSRLGSVVGCDEVRRTFKSQGRRTRLRHVPNART